MTAMTPFGTVKENQPYSYVLETGEKVPSSFDLTDNILSFELNNHQGTLVIDPVLEWGTYYGASGYDVGMGIVADDQGNYFMSGTSSSSSNIATVGSFQTSISGGYDGFITKFNSSNQRLWGTYFGGTANEFVRSMACDLNANLYVAGGTNSSSGIATPGSYQSTFKGGSALASIYDEAFIVKFDSAGKRVWGTYFGGTDDDEAASIFYDKKTNSLLVGGTTISSTDIATSNAFQVTISNYNYDNFILKMDTAGVRQWSTYYGGAAADKYALTTCDTNGYIYVAGYTASTNGIATIGAFQATNGGGLSDAFLSKFTPLGGLIWGTYLGGTGADEAYALKSDDSGNIYIAGPTSSNNNISTNGANQAISGGANDGYLMKFTSNGQKRWGTYYGGSNNDVLVSMDLDRNNNIFVGGYSASLNNMTTSGAYQTSYGGGADDAILAKFDIVGQMKWATYYGGNGYEGIVSLHYSEMTGQMLLTGNTSSTSGIATSGSFQATKVSGSTSDDDAYIASFIVDTIVSLSKPYLDTVLCTGLPFNLSYKVSLPFNAGNIFVAQLSDVAGSFSTPVNIGTLTSGISGSLTCTIPVGTLPGTAYRIRILSSNPGSVSADNGPNISIYQSQKPTVSLAASTLSTGPWNTITFKAVTTNGGSNPTFVWYKNGNPIPGINTDTYSGVTDIDFLTNDQICVAVKSNLICASPDTVTSNCLTINVDLHVDSINSRNLPAIYPVPTSKMLFITGASSGSQIEILDMVGKHVYSLISSDLETQQLDVSHFLVGTYVIRITNIDGSRVVRKFVKD
ncbi:SBBP repeat-containing protein [uncultured Dysgonomonas sp.]|uniref:SBBP repeat-containing protein n=1 Tax=uncultured Dysgonomonas sp. TaxID=206096 RepID=UPI002635CD82|nr:SBBP repeat-containing protein [uncultured Dysgonomonas sp.]